MVFVKPDPEDGELDFHIVENGIVPTHELPLNCVDAVSVVENQEDSYVMTPLFRLEVLNKEGLQVDLAPLADSDEESFRKIITRLHDLINVRCSMAINEA